MAKPRDAGRRGFRHATTDTARFDLLVQRGDLAAGSGNIAALRGVMRDMVQIMAFGSEPSADVAALAGLRR